MKESGNTLSQATKDRILRAVAVMQATVKTAKIQKLAQSTNLRDLSPDLLAWLGTTKDAEWLMGWPAGWTSATALPASSAAEMASYRSRLQQRLSCLFAE